jgi:ribose transport system substrate-binding protein
LKRFGGIYALQRSGSSGCCNDPSALGALRAFQEADAQTIALSWGRTLPPKRGLNCAKRNTRLIGSVGYFPERYGADLIRLSLDILNQRHVAPAVFVQHKLVTAQNVDHHYPNDGLEKMVTCPSTVPAPVHP